MANPHATLKKTKFFLNRPQNDHALDDRLEPFLITANEWFERDLRDAMSTPIPVSADTESISSQYAAGTWEMINQQDKTKIPANLTLAQKALEKFKSTAQFTKQEASFLKTRGNVNIL